MVKPRESSVSVALSSCPKMLSAATIHMVVAKVFRAALLSMNCTMARMAIHAKVTFIMAFSSDTFMPIGSAPTILVVMNKMMSVMSGNRSFRKLWTMRFMRPGQSAFSMASRNGLRSIL